MAKTVKMDKMIKIGKTTKMVKLVKMAKMIKTVKMIKTAKSQNSQTDQNGQNGHNGQNSQCLNGQNDFSISTLLHKLGRNQRKTSLDKIHTAEPENYRRNIWHKKSFCLR